MLSDLYNLNFGNKSVIAAGASTSICAIMGLYIADLYIQAKKERTVKMPTFKILSMLISLLVVSVLPGVDFFGHIGSLISGVFLGTLILTWEEKSLELYRFFIGVAYFGYSMMLFTIFL